MARRGSRRRPKTNDELVVLVRGESLHGRVVQRIVEIEKRDDDRCVEDD
jgi:hypothetical protein